MALKRTIAVQNTNITLYSHENEDYLSLTDIARYRDNVEPFSIINNWMRTRATIEFLGLWESLHNKDFKPIEFERFRNEAGSNYFVLSPQRWIKTTGAIGIFSKSGRYGGTFAQEDIAFEFASWISPPFKLYLITEFQRLKNEENKRLNLEWNLQRTLAKINYRIHTDAIKDKIIPDHITKEQANAIYASEADLLNVALFGQTAKQWRDTNQNKEANVRDYATLEQLVVLSNLESINALLVHQGMKQHETAIAQMKSLVSNKNIKLLK